MRLSHVSAITVSGALWLFAGFLLLRKGIYLLMIVSLQKEPSGILSFFAQGVGGKEQAGLLLVLAGLFLGYIKGRTVLAKTVRKVVERIFSLPSPLKLTEMYTFRYYLIISLMVGLGVLLRWLPIASELKGTVDVAIGSALINGAILYFRSAIAARKQRSIENG